MLWGFLSTYPPTECGLATFTHALAGALDQQPGVDCRIVASVDAPSRALPPGVAAELVAGDRVSQRRAAEVLNGCDVAVIQHEFGIYGGPDGAEVLEVLRRLRVPTVVVLHTVVSDPTPSQRRVVSSLAAGADALVTMSGAARSRLVETHQVSRGHVTVIPHGATVGDVLTGPVPNRILTWGLLGPGKGIEWGIAALAQLQDLDPTPHYLVAGQIHPKVRAREGEAYRDHLLGVAERAGVLDQVCFDPTYRPTSAMPELIASASVVLLPYDSTEQVTSGVLIEAVAARKPVVATRFPHAVELLADGVGVTVPHRNPLAIARAIRGILTEPGTAASLTESASRVAGELSWAAVARRYVALGRRLVAEGRGGSALPISGRA